MRTADHKYKQRAPCAVLHAADMRAPICVRLFAQKLTCAPVSALSTSPPSQSVDTLLHNCCSAHVYNVPHSTTSVVEPLIGLQLKLSRSVCELPSRQRSGKHFGWLRGARVNWRKMCTKLNRQKVIPSTKRLIHWDHRFASNKSETHTERERGH